MIPSRISSPFTDCRAPVEEDGLAALMLGHLGLSLELPARRVGRNQPAARGRGGGARPEETDTEDDRWAEASDALFFFFFFFFFFSVG